MVLENPVIPSALDRHLSASSNGDIASVASYLDRGSDLVTPAAVAALRRFRRPLHDKIEAIEVSEHLRRRLEVLALYFDEASVDGHAGTPAHHDATFALFYFLKGFDRIPDDIPDIGLLDDAMIVQIVLQRHGTVIRAHWLRWRRAWPSDL